MRILKRVYILYNYPFNVFEASSKLILVSEKHSEVSITVLHFENKKMYK